MKELSTIERYIERIHIYGDSLTTEQTISVLRELQGEQDALAEEVVRLEEQVAQLTNDLDESEDLNKDLRTDLKFAEAKLATIKGIV